MPWDGLQAAEIQHEVIQLGHELDLSSSRVASDPFHTVLQYGMSRNADDRRLSLEQIRDVLAERLLVRSHSTLSIVATSNDTSLHFCLSVSLVVKYLAVIASFVVNQGNG